MSGGGGHAVGARRMTAPGPSAARSRTVGGLDRVRRDILATARYGPTGNGSWRRARASALAAGPGDDPSGGRRRGRGNRVSGERRSQWPDGTQGDAALDGTSMAAPLVSAVAALLVAQGLEPEEVAARLEATASHPTTDPGLGAAVVARTADLRRRVRNTGGDRTSSSFPRRWRGFASRHLFQRLRRSTGSRPEAEGSLASASAARSATRHSTTEQ